MMGISQIIMSQKRSCISSVDMLNMPKCYTLNLSVVKNSKFLVCMVTDPFFADKPANDDVIIHRITMAHPYRWTVAKLSLEKSVH